MSDSESDDTTPALSAATLAALAEFALDRGIEVEPDGSNIVENVQKACDVQDREDSWQYDFGDDIHLTLTGLKRELGQTLGSTGLTLWRAADNLSTYMNDNRDFFRGRVGIELGSGLGLNGILASKICKQVVITDGDDETIDLLRRNCKANNCFGGEEGEGGATNGNVAVHKLWWGEQVGELLKEYPERFDLVFAADVIYEEESVIPLFSTAYRLLADPVTPPAASEEEQNAVACPQADPVFVLAYHARNVSFDFILKQADLAGFEWEHAPGFESTATQCIFIMRKKKQQEEE